MRISRPLLLSAIPTLALGTAAAAEVTFIPHRIGTNRTEACAVADFNGDGKPDIAAGPTLYLAPDWRPVTFRTVSGTVGEDGKGYADDFCNLILDVNGDGKPDVLAATWFAQTSFWFENTFGAPGLWPLHTIEKLGNHETGTLEDIDGDGRALEFLPQTQITVWYEGSGDAEGRPAFVRHTVSTNRMEFGAGAGDLNGDGRPDIIRPNAWFEAPADIRTGTWREHPLSLGAKGGKTGHTSNILVCDVNRDGLNDLIASSAHGHGIFWYAQRRTPDGGRSWEQHVIDDSWSQAHYLAFADLDGDGHPEIITGKRFMAHNGGDPDAYGKLCLYFYRFTPGPVPSFSRHPILVDQGIGAGLNIVAADMDGDGDLDLVTTGKWGGPVLIENRLIR
ncbi:MAG: VCBS repeat-containing protein [Kiritimatiellia bacterium]|jgi:hypothetical protein|nr:VCBS repeat-containing protein [Kiritimatiellia bacterium]